MSLAFLTPAAGPLAPPAVSPMAAPAAAAGGLVEVRDGWAVPVGFGDRRVEEQAVERAVGWADASYLTKLELQGPAAELAGLAGGLRTGVAVRACDAWWCLATPTRALVLGDAAATAGAVAAEVAAAASGVRVLDVSTQYAGLRIAGPQARETFARFCALDLRPERTPVGAARPGSVARTPGLVLREGPERYLALVGAALAEYLWAVVADAGGALGGRPVGVDVLASPTLLEGAGSHA